MAVLLVVVVAVVFLPRHAGGPKIVASAARTPGVLNPDVSQSSIRSTICTRGWTSTIRPPVSYTDALKRKQMRQYGEAGLFGWPANPLRI